MSAGARLLRLDGVTLETAGGGFSSARYALALESGTIASTLPARAPPGAVGRPPRVRSPPRCARRHGPSARQRGRPAGRGRLGLAPLDDRAPRHLLADPDPDRRGSRAAAHGRRRCNEEGMRVRAGIALLATMLEPASLTARSRRIRPRRRRSRSARPAGAVQLAEPDLRERRAAAQTARTRDDAALATRLGAAFDIDRRDAGRAHRRPAAGRRAAARGDALLRRRRRRHRGPRHPRARERARAARAASTCRSACATRRPSIDAPCPVRRLSKSVVREILAGSDAIVLQGPVSDWYPEILASDVPIAVDLYDPMNLEALESQHADQLVPYTTQLLRAQVARGDFFFCASERQRDYWIGMLAGAGRVDERRLPRRSRSAAAHRRRPVRDPERAAACAPRRACAASSRESATTIRCWSGTAASGAGSSPSCSSARSTSRARAVPNVRAYFMGVRDPRVDELSPEAQRARSRWQRASGCATRTSSSTTGRPTTRARTSTSTPLPRSASIARTSRRASRSARASSTASGPRCRSSAASGDVLADLVRNERARHHGPGRGASTPPRTPIVRIASDDGLRQASRDNLTALAHRHTWSTALRAARRPGSRGPSRSGPPMDLDSFELDERTRSPARVVHGARAAATPPARARARQAQAAAGGHAPRRQLRHA